VTQTLDKSVSTVLFPAAEPASLRHPLPALQRSFNTVLDFVFPPHCVSCGLPLPPDVNKSLCVSCALRIRWIGSDRCRHCGDAVGQGQGAVDECPSCRTFPPRFIQAASALAVYESGPLRDLVLSLKFGRKIHVAWTLGDLLARRIAETGLLVPGTVLVPTPLTRSGLRERGFNQAEELARRIGTVLKLPVETGLLKKIRSTPPQATLGTEQRRENLNGAFACNRNVAKRFTGANILLIDDVITTCSTISECARTLADSEIKSVRAASIARG
jgi:ComF family protein